MLRSDPQRFFQYLPQPHGRHAQLLLKTLKSSPTNIASHSVLVSPPRHRGAGSPARFFMASAANPNESKTLPRYHRMSTYKLEGYQQALERYREHNGRWGFVVFRTTYHSDDEWQHVKELIINRAKKHTPIPELVDHMDWVFFDDKNIFDGMSRSSLRERFHIWAADAASRTTLPPKDAGLASRYNFFFDVDEPSLRSIVDYTGVTTGGFLNLVDARWKPGCTHAGLDEEELEQQLHEDEDEEPIDGYKEWSVGWMKLEFKGLSIAFQVNEADGFVDDDSEWKRFYVRPPGVGIT